MAIAIYTGTPGSGKSYMTINRVLHWLRRGKYVICNFPITFTEKEIKKGYEDLFYYIPNQKMTIGTLLKFVMEKNFIQKRKEKQCLLVIDEAGGKFNCREYGKSDRQAWNDFFSQHRKLGFEVHLVAQRDRMIDRQIREMIEEEHRCRKLNNFSFLFILPWTFFVSAEYWYPIKQKVGSTFIKYNKELGERYDTFKMFSGGNLEKYCQEYLKLEMVTEIYDDGTPNISVIWEQ